RPAAVVVITGQRVPQRILENLVRAQHPARDARSGPRKLDTEPDRSQRLHELLQRRDVRRRRREVAVRPEIHPDLVKAGELRAGGAADETRRRSVDLGTELSKTPIGTV